MKNETCIYVEGIKAFHEAMAEQSWKDLEVVVRHKLSFALQKRRNSQGQKRRVRYNFWLKISHHRAWIYKIKMVEIRTLNSAFHRLRT